MSVITELQERIKRMQLKVQKKEKIDVAELRAAMNALRDEMLKIVAASPELRGKVTILSLTWEDVQRDVDSFCGALGSNIVDRECGMRWVLRDPETEEVVDSTEWIPAFVVALTDNFRDATVVAEASQCLAMTKDDDLNDAQIVTLPELLAPDFLRKRFASRGLAPGSDLRTARMMASYKTAICPPPPDGWDTEIAVVHKAYKTHDAKNPKNAILTMTPLTTSLTTEAPRNYSFPQRLMHNYKGLDGKLHDHTHGVELTKRKMNVEEVGSETEAEKEAKRANNEVASERLLLQDTALSGFCATLTVELEPMPPPPPPPPAARTTRSLGIPDYHPMEEEDNSVTYKSLAASDSDDDGGKSAAPVSRGLGSEWKPKGYRSMAGMAPAPASDPVYRGADAPAPAPALPALNHKSGCLYEAGIGLGSELGETSPLARALLKAAPNVPARLDVNLTATCKDCLTEDALVGAVQLMRHMFAEAAERGVACADRLSSTAVALGISQSSKAGTPQAAAAGAPEAQPPPTATPLLTAASLMDPEGFIPKKRKRRTIGSAAPIESALASATISAPLPVTPANSPAAVLAA